MTAENISEGTTIHTESQSNGYGTIMRQPGLADEDDDDESSVYTELLQGSVPCPTCRGLGNVPKEQEGQLVALIPMKDKRLKPRRTYIWVCLAIFICLTVAGLVIFFLFPRSVAINSNRPYLDPVGSVNVSVQDSYVSFMLSNRFNITNSNYLPAKMTGVQMTVLYDTQVLAEAKNNTVLNVPMRSEREYYIEVNVTFNKDNQMGYMADSCISPVRWAHELVMLFQFTCSYEVLGHSEQTTLQTFQFVSCYSTVTPSTIKPPTTSQQTTQSTSTEHMTKPLSTELKGT